MNKWLDTESHFDISSIACSCLWDQITTCCNKPDGQSHDEFRAVSSAHISVLHRTSSLIQLK